VVRGHHTGRKSAWGWELGRDSSFKLPQLLRRSHRGIHVLLSSVLGHSSWAIKKVVGLDETWPAATKAAHNVRWCWAGKANALSRSSGHMHHHARSRRIRGIAPCTYGKSILWQSCLRTCRSRRPGCGAQTGYPPRPAGAPRWRRRRSGTAALRREAARSGESPKLPA